MLIKIDDSLKPVPSVQDKEQLRRIFTDSNALQVIDPSKPEGKNAFVILGCDRLSGKMIVCQYVREKTNVAKVFAYRKATSNECSVYEQRKTSEEK